MPESVWKAYIDFEIESNEDGSFSHARELYSRLLTLTNHVKVWLSWAKFEHETAHDIEKARSRFMEAHKFFKKEMEEVKDERAMVLEAWFAFESDPTVNSHGAESKKA